jgi:tRNA(Ile)-lysidine synthase
MAAFGPFEKSPDIAVALSGGPDSLALTVLLDGWARRRRGTVTALTVDHGLRPESAAEARQVGRWLRARGIRHRILRWQHAKAGCHWRGGVQAAARAARYRLLGEWCRANRVLHLALGHQQEDQAETFLLRLSRASGLDGLSAMAPVAERDGVRLIRPLLNVPRARLLATLGGQNQDWIDDPSNRNFEHARVRLRNLLPKLGGDGVTPARLAATARELGRRRAVIDDGVAELLARAAQPNQAGYVIIDAAALRGAPAEIGRHGLARCLQYVGGQTYGPRLDRLERLYKAIADGAPLSPATLGGCRILPRAGGRLLICRETGLAAPRLKLAQGSTVIWDGRFRVQISARRAGRERRQIGVSVGCLGPEGWAEVTSRRPDLRHHPLAPAARSSLPALWRAGRVIAVPHLDYWRDEQHLSVSIRPWPAMPLAPVRFTVA